MFSDSRHRGPLILLAIAAAALATRIPLLAYPRLYGDEIFYALVGHEWLKGALPYVQIWDVKPPGLFALYALSEAVSGDSLLGPRLLPLLATLAAAIGLWRLGEGWFADWRIGLLAAILYCANTLSLGGAMGASELLFAPFVIFGLLFATRAGMAFAALAGLLLGCAFTIKQVVAFEGLLGLILVVHASQPVPGQRLRRAAAYCTAGALPGIAFALLYAAHGQFGLLWDSAIVSAFGRTGGDGVTLIEGFLLFFAGFKAVLPLLLAGLLAFLERRRLALGADRAGLMRAVWWLAASSAGVLAIRSMYAHYFLPLVAPLSLIAAKLLVDVAARATRAAPRAAAAASLAALCAYPLAWTTLQGEWPTENRNTEALAERLVALGVRPGASGADLFIADHEVATYLLTDTSPPTRYVIAQHLTCDFALPHGARADEVIDNVLNARPRFVVVTEPRKFLSCALPERLERVAGHLRQDYVLVDRIADAQEPLLIYERKGRRAGLALD